MTQGVIVGSDHRQEWILPWWWAHFKDHHNLPIAFIDFGMTMHAKKWCQLRGDLISVEKQGKFYRPFALLKTPFKETIWVDLDCEILGSLAHLFKKIHRHSALALVRDNTGPFEEVGYNPGVIVYDIQSPLLAHWASCMQPSNIESDQAVLTHLIQDGNIEVAELPSKYNWVVKKGINPEAVVLHWAGAWGKQIVSGMSRKERI